MRITAVVRAQVVIVKAEVSVAIMILDTTAKALVLVTVGTVPLRMQASAASPTIHLPKVNWPVVWYGSALEAVICIPLILC